METALWLVLIQGIGVLVLAVTFGVSLVLFKGLIDRLMETLESLRAMVQNIDGEIKPILRDVQSILHDVEPLTKELGDRNRDVGSLIANLEKVSDDVSATTRAVRVGVVPIAHTLAGVMAGFTEAGKAMKRKSAEMSYDNEPDLNG